MEIAGKNLSRSVFVIAEVGNNHEGDFSVAIELVRRAAEAGADAVKFQTFRPEYYVSAKDEARFQRLKKFQFTFAQFEQLKDEADKRGIIFFSTPFDLESAGFLGRIAAAVKIASGDNTFFPLIARAAESGKPLIVSGGLATAEELVRVRDFIFSANPTYRQRGNLAFLHCVSSYPVPPEQANLAAIATMKRTLETEVGYSDHTIGIEACPLAVAMGARIIEKHFTLSKTFSDFRDHQLSADPADMREMVAKIRMAEAMIGDGRKVPQASEAQGAPGMRRSIVAGQDLPAGTVLRMEHLTWIRPAGGIAPGNEQLLLGRKTKKALAFGELITAESMA